jgi:sigma-B regulation protein RsbU (phosphoserine phosphatase)
MAAPYSTQPSATGARPGRRIQNYWARVTEGANLQQLWKQFSADARQSYALYSREVDWDALQGRNRFGRGLHGAWAVFQSMLMKLSPARRVLLLAAMVLLVYPLPAVLIVDNLAAETGLIKMFVVGAGLLFVLLALELADRVTMKRDLEIAREIQHWLIPDRPPVIQNADIAFATRPANTVSGDYYDVLPRSSEQGEQWLMVVADVAGKSIPAALLMATFQASLHTLIGASETLCDLTAGLNGYATAHSQGGRRFTTAFFAEYNCGSRILSYINAGHNPPILKRANGNFESLNATGLPLGIPAAEPGESGYEQKSLQLAPGDTLVIYTDGLVEAVNAQGVEFGEDRLLAMLRFPVKETSALMLERLFTEVGRFVGETHQQDDITCLVFQAV